MDFIKVTFAALLAHGFQYGHTVSETDTRSYPYLLGERSGMEVFDVAVASRNLRYALALLVSVAARRGNVLFINPGQIFLDKFEDQLADPFINVRYTARKLPGVLTNFRGLKRFYLRDEDLLTLRRLPSFVLIFNSFDHHAVREAARLNIPQAAFFDSNTNPVLANFYPLPANDDSLLVRFFFTRLVLRALHTGFEQFVRRWLSRRNLAIRSSLTLTEAVQRAKTRFPAATVIAESVPSMELASGLVFRGLVPRHFFYPSLRGLKTLGPIGRLYSRSAIGKLGVFAKKRIRLSPLRCYLRSGLRLLRHVSAEPRVVFQKFNWSQHNRLPVSRLFQLQRTRRRLILRPFSFFKSRFKYKVVSKKRKKRAVKKKSAVTGLRSSASKKSPFFRARLTVFPGFPGHRVARRHFYSPKPSKVETFQNRRRSAIAVTNAKQSKSLAVKKIITVSPSLPAQFWRRRVWAGRPMKARADFASINGLGCWLLDKTRVALLPGSARGVAFSGLSFFRLQKPFLVEKNLRPSIDRPVRLTNFARQAESAFLRSVARKKCVHRAQRGFEKFFPQLVFEPVSKSRISSSAYSRLTWRKRQGLARRLYRPLTKVERGQLASLIRVPKIGRFFSSRKKRRRGIEFRSPWGYRPEFPWNKPHAKRSLIQLLRFAVSPKRLRNGPFPIRRRPDGTVADPSARISLHDAMRYYMPSRYQRSRLQLFNFLRKRGGVRLTRKYSYFSPVPTLY